MNIENESSITKIGPSGGWINLDIGELWKYRELLYFLTWRDVKIRYKQTLLGVAWAVLQPVLTTIIFSVIFGRFAGFNTPIPYPLFVLTGLSLWLFVNTSVSMASTSFVNHSNLVTKVYFPRIIMPVAATLASLFDLIFSFAILALLMAYYGVAPSAQIILVPVMILLTFILSASVGTLFAALNIRFRDVKFALPFLLQVWMISSPIFYPINLISEKWRPILALNPLTGIIEGFRSAIFGIELDWEVIGISSAATIIIALVSIYIFIRMEDEFADVI